MRLEARVLEAGTQTTALAPFKVFAEFRKVHKRSVNASIRAEADRSTDDDFTTWQPWFVWYTMKLVHGEERSLDDWSDSVEWIGVYEAEDELDPSGGEETSETATSPGSSSDATAGPSSSSTTRVSKARSGPRSAAA